MAATAPLSSAERAFLEMTEEESSKKVKTLKNQLKEMPTDLRIFSISMRSLYAQEAVGGVSQPAVDFRKLRDETRNDAMVYIKGVLSLTARFVECLSEYFGWYEFLEFDEWSEDLKEILVETTLYRETCEILVKIHEEMLVTLKKRQHQASIIVNQFNDLEQEFQVRKKKLEERTHSKRSWAAGLAFTQHLIGPILTTFLSNSADKDLAEAVAEGVQVEIEEAATVTMTHTMLPAFQQFTKGLIGAANFFSATENDLRKLRKQTHGSSVAKRKKLYYDIMRKESKEIKEMCRQFFVVLPEVRADFNAIPTEGTDLNYVDKWLEKEKKIIKESVSYIKLAVSMIAAIGKVVVGIVM